MTELFDTRGVKDDAEHWDAVAERVAREAMRRSRYGSGYGSAGLIAASLLLAASIAFMTMTSRHAAPSPAVMVGQALAPSDDVGRAIAQTGSPPAVAALLLEGQP